MVILLFIFYLWLFNLPDFYFLSSVRKSLHLLRVCQVISLFIIARSLEDFAYAKDYSILRMKEGEETEHNINSFRERHDKEVQFFKDKSVKRIIEAHGSYFSEIVDYEDWDGAMKFLNSNRKAVFDFLTKKG